MVPFFIVIPLKIPCFLFSFFPSISPPTFGKVVEERRRKKRQKKEKKETPKDFKQK